MIIDTASRPVGALGVSPDRLDNIVSRCLALPAHVTGYEVVPVDYASGSIGTDSLRRYAGTAMTAIGEQRWSIFVKGLRSARFWPLLSVIPAELRELWVGNFPWRIEIDAYRSRLPEILPDTMRLPDVYDIVEVDEDHAVIWMEDVAVAQDRWTVPRFEAAAFGLGQLAGRRPVGTDVVFHPGQSALTPGSALREFAFGRIRTGVGQHLADDDLWRHPALLDALTAQRESGLREQLRAAMDRLDPWLDAMDALPQAYPHGDASPQNLLVPVDAPQTFVLIDFGFNSPHCVGFDLGQLLIGLTHAGELDSAALPEIHRAIVPAYVDGLASTGFEASPGDVVLGCRNALLVRGLFTALPLEQLGETDSDELRELVAIRMRLARFLLELAGFEGPGPG